SDSAIRNDGLRVDDGSQLHDSCDRKRRVPALDRTPPARGAGAGTAAGMTIRVLALDSDPLEAASSRPATRRAAPRPPTFSRALIRMTRDVRAVPRPRSRAAAARRRSARGGAG